MPDSDKLQTTPVYGQGYADGVAAMEGLTESEQKQALAATIARINADSGWDGYDAGYFDALRNIAPKDAAPVAPTD